MALGLQTESSGGGDFTPIIKFDARAGRMFRVDREQDASGSWNTENVEVNPCPRVRPTSTSRASA
jgi:hypothetical protein